MNQPGDSTIKILVLGNIHSGKTTFISGIKNHFLDLPVYSIDTFRKKYSDGTLMGESVAIENFIKSINETPDCIIEATGFGEVGQKLLTLQDSFVFVFELEVPIKTILERIKASNNFKTPYPFQHVTIEETAIALNKRFQNNDIHSMWAKKVRQHWKLPGTLPPNEQLKLIPLQQLVWFIKIKTLLEKENLAVFGSLSKGTIHVDSDLDFIVKTNRSAMALQQDFSYLKPYYSDILGQKLVFFPNKHIKIEIVVTHSIFEYASYIKNKPTNTYQDWFIHGDKQFQDELKQLAKLPTKSLENYAMESIEQMNYYYLSLNTLINKGDIYKFNFHLHIIHHAYVVASSLLNDVQDHLYLPQMSSKYIPEKACFENAKTTEDMSKIYSMLPDTLLSTIQKLLKKYRLRKSLSSFAHIYVKEDIT